MSSTITSTPQTQDSDQIRVERLLQQLAAAQSMALVPYDLGRIPAPPPSPHKSIATIIAVVAGLWVGTAALALAYFWPSIAPFRQAKPFATERTIVVDKGSQEQQQKMLQSIGTLTSALASSSERLQRIERELAQERESKAAKKWAAPATTPVAKARGSAPLPRVLIVPRAKTAAPRDPMGFPPDPDPPIAKIIPAKSWHEFLDLKPHPSAVPHKSAEGTTDYWLLPRNNDRGHMARVLSFGTNPDGVLVHNMDDGKDYTILLSGEWRSAEH